MIRAGARSCSSIRSSPSTTRSGTAPASQALREAGVEADDVDVVVNSHVDGLGVNLLLDGSPTLPPGPLPRPARPRSRPCATGRHPEPETTPRSSTSHDAGVIEATDGDEEVAPGVRLADAPGHNPGHHVVWVGDGDEAAVVVGHLFLHPAQIASPEVENGDLDPVVLAEDQAFAPGPLRHRRRLLVGPLFASPGAGRVRPQADTWRLDPVE